MSSYPLHALRELLAQTVPTRGVVVRAWDGRVQVATSAGLVTASTTAPLAVGSRATIARGVASPSVAVRRADVYAL